MRWHRIPAVSFNEPLGRYLPVLRINRWPIALLLFFYPTIVDATPQLITLVNLDSNNEYPRASLVEDANGNLFDTSGAGGTDQLGSIFEVSHGAQTATLLASFNGTNGYGPGAGVLNVSGNLYGTSGNGGSTYSTSAVGYGAVFELSSGSNSVAVLHSFSGFDGYGPGGLVSDSQGNLFGTTVYGGSGFTGQIGGAIGNGTLFEIPSSTHTLQAIMSFGGNYGVNPTGLTEGPNGLFYGTTASGGSDRAGTIFDVNPTNGQVTTVGNFGSTNGSSPNPGLAFDSAGDIFGTMNQGGAYGFGTVFELPVASSVRTVFSFGQTGGPVYPRSAPLIDANGDIFGTTMDGGSGNSGTVYEIPIGANAVTTVVPFNSAIGQYPTSLIADSTGDLFGVTSQAGPLGYGTVFEISNSGFAVPEPKGLVVLVALAALAIRPRHREGVPRISRGC